MAYDGLGTPFGKADRILGGAAVYGALAASQFTIDFNLKNTCLAGGHVLWFYLFYIQKN